MENLDYDPDEVIVVSSTTCVNVIDAKTKKTIKSYKVNKIAPKCLALLGEEYFIGAITNVPDIKIWTVREEKGNSQMASPCGIVNALAVTSCGSYCVAAIKQEIRVWNVNCGEMLASISHHYQDVTCLRFTSDDSMFISGGKDGSVLVWVLSSVTSVNCNPEQIKPLYSWNSHSKEVTDIFVGSMGIYSRVATSSTDMTCKIYELDTGILLSTVCFDVPLSSVVMDPLEYYLIVGTQKGSICKVNLYYEQPRELHTNAMEKDEIIAHRTAVSCLSISVVGDKLLSASLDGTFKIWEVASLSCIASVPSSDGSFTNAFFTLRPAPLLTRQEPHFLVNQLQRDFLSPNQRNQANSSKPLKLHDHPFYVVQAGSLDNHYPSKLISGDPVVVAPSTTEETAKENMFQEVYRGETLNEVREINAQIYTYMIEQAFKSLDPPGSEPGEQMHF